MHQNKIIENILLELEQMKEKLSKQNDIILQLREENRQLKIENNLLKKENHLLKQEIKKLKESANKDSTNSSKPPSTDNGFKEKKSNKDGVLLEGIKIQIEKEVVKKGIQVTTSKSLIIQI